jgi:hypothetical protein
MTPPSNPDIRGHCWHCGAGLTHPDYGRENACLDCGKATRSCRNCARYAPGRANDCSEPLAEPVADKQRANFCELFDPARQPAAADPGGPTEDLRQAAEALFK